MLWIIYTLLAALSSSIRHILSKNFPLKEHETTDYITLNYVLGILMLLPFIYYLQAVPSLSVLLQLLVFALSGTIGVSLLFYVYSKTEISSTAPLQNFSPVILLLTSFIFLGEVLSFLQLTGVFLIIVGGYLISLKSIKNFFHPFTRVQPKYLLLILITLTLWSIAAPFFKLSLLSLSFYSVLFYSTTISAIFWSIVAVFTGNVKNIFIAFKNNKITSILGATAYLGVDLFGGMALAIPSVMVTVMIPLKRTGTLFSVIIGGNMFKEKNLVFKSFSCIIMLLGVLLISFFS